ncbi:MAG: arginine--tRNA ligase, partial [Candidatus Dojkabacteria bacterium]|nr:arginine--tRNA ligase [Candidatus Dojkabacteria bacterium]
LKYLTPFGGEELTEVYGDFELKFANGSEHWLGISAEKAKSPKEGDLIWGDDFDVSTLSLNWRQCERTKLDGDDKIGFFIMDGFVKNKDNVKAAAEELISRVIELYSLNEDDAELLLLDSKNLESEYEYETKSIKGVEIPEIRNQKSKVKSKKEKEKVEHRYNDETKDSLQKTIFDVVTNLYGDETIAIQYEIFLEIPKDNTHGDYATNIAMQIVKKLGKNPREIASEIVENINSDLVDKAEVAGPGFINFFVNTDIYTSVVREILEKRENFGKSEIKKGKTVLIEHTSPNPNKEFHIGHLKTNVIGISTARIFEAVGAKVYRDCIDNNRGIAIARLMWGYLEFAKKDDSLPTDLNYWFDNKEKWNTPESANTEPGRFVDQLYTKATEPFKNDPEVEKAVRKMVIDWESEDEKNWALWELTQKWVWEGYRNILTRIDGLDFDKVWHEHELYKNGKKHVERGLKEGIFKKLDDGAVITDFNKFDGITDTVLIKNDGTSLYITQDLELTYRKREEFHPDEMYWVIGPEQSLAMKQMFKACSQLGFGEYEDYHHIPYGFILAKGADGNAKKMSSRDGTSEHVSDLIECAKKEISKFLEERDFDDSEKDNIAETIAIGAIKYALLSVNRVSDQVFDFNTTISFEGNSAPYIIYSYARANSVLNKAGNIDFDSVKFKYETEEELDLLKHLKNFSNEIISASVEYAPNYIANYVYELAQKFNKFYRENQILNAETNEQKVSRLALAKATARVVKNGLYLLGIKTVEKM